VTAQAAAAARHWGGATHWLPSQINPEQQLVVKAQASVAPRQASDGPDPRRADVDPEDVALERTVGMRCLGVPDDATGAMVSENATFPQLALRGALGRAGPRRIRLHDLRHQSVAAFLMAGGSIYDTEKNLGHASVAFTAADYGHLSGDHRVAESDRLSFKIPGDITATVMPFTAPEE
jgi:hypothetical protein